MDFVCSFFNRNFFNGLLRAMEFSGSFFVVGSLSSTLNWELLPTSARHIAGYKGKAYVNVT